MLDSTPMAKMYLICAIVTSFVLRFIHRIYFSPLARIPRAHPTSLISATWVWWRRRNGRESRSILAAHQRHGPVVLLAPNEVSFATLSALRTIYVGGFARTSWFDEFKNYETPNLVTTYDGRQHAARRRVVAGIFSKSHLLRAPDVRDMMQELLFRRLLPALEGEVDVYELALAAGAEFVNAHQLGTAHSMDIMRKERTAARQEYLHLGNVKLRHLPGWQPAQHALEQQLLDLCRPVEAFLRSGKEGRGTFPVVYAQLRNAFAPNDSQVGSLPEKILDIATDLLDNVEAGRVGLGIALAYTMYELSRHPATQAALQQELIALGEELSIDSGTGFSPTTLRIISDLPLLDAVVMETLRRYAPAPGPQRRAVPAGGAEIDGYWLPGGVVVHAAPYVLHRTASVFNDPESWLPERWLNGKGDERRWFWPFGSGGKMCLGNHFAELVMKVVLAGVYANFQTAVSKAQDPALMRPQDDMMGYPEGEACLLVFQKLRACDE